jgi:hypothetical protein
MSANPKGVHFIGSVPFRDARETFSTLSHSLPHHISRLPDGEPDARQIFIRWQTALFKPYPKLLNFRTGQDASLCGAPITSEEFPQVTRYLETLDTGYDRAAIDSYAVFRNLRAEGVIPPGVKFQVCVPTATNTISAAIASVHRNFVEPYYVAALRRALSNIQNAIPHADLAIQIDCAHEFGILEQIWKVSGEYRDRFQPWWVADPLQEPANQEIFDGVIDRIVQLAGNGHVAPDVEVGFHLCYGDIGHKHFVEPKDTALMTRVATALLTRLGKEGRSVAFLHLPVPKEREDDAYFASLQDLLPALREHHTQLYLGLVQEEDLAGTQRRIATARRIIPDDSGVEWGCATECGLGRTDPNMVPSIIEILKTVSSPLRSDDSLVSQKDQRP